MNSPKTTTWGALAVALSVIPGYMVVTTLADQFVAVKLTFGALALVAKAVRDYYTQDVSTPSDPPQRLP